MNQALRNANTDSSSSSSSKNKISSILKNDSFIPLSKPCSEEIDELSDIVSMPSITLTNDEYFRLAKGSSSASQTADTTTTKLEENSAVISQSENMKTTTNTVSQETDILNQAFNQPSSIMNSIKSFNDKIKKKSSSSSSNSLPKKNKNLRKLNASGDKSLTSRYTSSTGKLESNLNTIQSS